MRALADPTAGMHQLQRITQPVQQHQRTYRGFDFFSAQDQPMLLTLLRGEFTIRGFGNKRPSPSSARQNQQSALALPQEAPPPRASSQDPAILSVSPEPLRPKCDHPRLQTPRLGDHTGACCVCPPLKILPIKHEISRGRDLNDQSPNG